MLLGLSPARYRDAVRLQLQFLYGGLECPTSLLEGMELQLDKFEAREETLSVMACDRIIGEPSDQAKAGSSGKGGSAKAKREGSSSGDSGTSWGSCYLCGKPGHHTARCPDRGKQGGSHRSGGPTFSD